MTRRWLPALLICSAAAQIPLSVSPKPVRAEEPPITVSSTYTYTVDPVENVVHVAVELTVTSPLVSGYFTSLRAVVPEGATPPTGIQVTDPPQRNSPRPPLQASVVTTDPITGGTIYNFNIYARSLFTLRVQFAYDLADGLPRSERPSRFAGGYMSFLARPSGGDVGKDTIRIVTPATYEVDGLGPDWVSTEENGKTVHTLPAAANPESQAVFVTAHDDTAVPATAVEGPLGESFSILPWADDPEWAKFVTDQINSGMPALSQAIGLPSPSDQVVTARESAMLFDTWTPSCAAMPASGLVISEILDQRAALHELAHVWFNSTLFSERWLCEGFAELYANVAVSELGGTAALPDAIEADGPAAVKLDEWEPPTAITSADALASEAYGRNAAFSIMQQLFDEIGPDKMRAVLATLAAQAADPALGPAGWQRFLDAVEAVGGSSQAATLIERYVISPADRALLDRRADTRRISARVEARSAGWTPPQSVTGSVAAWEFTEALATLRAADEVLTARDELAPLLDRLGEQMPPEFEREYESDDPDYAALEESIRAANAAALGRLGQRDADGTSGAWLTLAIGGAVLAMLVAIVRRRRRTLMRTTITADSPADSALDNPTDPTGRSDMEREIDG